MFRGCLGSCERAGVANPASQSAPAQGAIVVSAMTRIPRSRAASADRDVAATADLLRGLTGSEQRREPGQRQTCRGRRARTYLGALLKAAEQQRQDNQDDYQADEPQQTACESAAPPARAAAPGSALHASRQGVLPALALSAIVIVCDFRTGGC